MKFSTPMYEGDSIIRPAPEPRDEAVETWHSTSKMVHRKIPDAHEERVGLNVAEPSLADIFEIERRARALRAAAVRAAMVSFWRWVERWFETSRRRRVEGYLARAQSIAELEARLRKLERGGYFVRV